MSKSELIKLINNSLPFAMISKVILFGSYAKENQTKDSDVDLLVVTNDNFIPASFAEKMQLKLKIAESLYLIRQQSDIDLLVYTKPMYEKFIEMDGSFKREILNTGTIIYEANN
ncbi:MAG: nucleotidyltransferase domain-containing protein [Paludibacter sp.]|nr:nucleotidyltransferase domain-containing protein [Paludibacter sp.]